MLQSRSKTHHLHSQRAASSHLTPRGDCVHGVRERKGEEKEKEGEGRGKKEERERGRRREGRRGGKRREREMKGKERVLRSKEGKPSILFRVNFK